MSELRNETEEVAIAGAMRSSFVALRFNHVVSTADASVAAGRVSAQAHTATAVPDDLRLNLPVLPSLALPESHIAAAPVSSPLTHATLRRQGSREETSRVSITASSLPSNLKRL